MEYQGYIIAPNLTGYVNFDFYTPESEIISGHGETIEDCKKQIDELLN
jgi:predicted RNase H-like HicB family nuclease